MTHESWTHCFCATGGVSSTQGVSKMRRPLSRRLLSQELLLLGSVSGDGLRPTDLPRESSRHRSMSSFRTRQTVSHGVPRSSGALDVGGRERVARLAHLRGIRPGVDRHRTAFVCTRSDRSRSGSEPVRAGLHHHRPLPVAVSLGAVPPAQSRRQNAHAARPARQHPHVYPHYRRQSARRQHPRRNSAGGGRVLRDGSRLHRFRAPLSLHALLRIFRRAHQRERLAPTPAILIRQTKSAACDPITP